MEVDERILADGSVVRELTSKELEAVVARVRNTGCTSVALCLLHSYANPAHEMQIAKALEVIGVQVSSSHRILREFREFERASTTAVNAAVSPVMESYLQRIQKGLGLQDRLKIMQSNGGSISARIAGSEGVRTILSGPAGGMVGAFSHAKDGGFDRIITFDMGGTSTDVGLCNGTIQMTTETTIAGWPVKVPMIDIHTVGAGGGSIARLDAGGALRVGPQSAGADPGPVCYGKGEEVTVTDANLYLGRLLPDRFLGGRMDLHVERTGEAIERLAAEAGLEAGRCAEGIIEVAESTMAAALRVVSVEKGHDPRDFLLLPFGGAGGLHACTLAEKLGIERILLPPHPGLLSAVGMVRSDSIRDYSISVLHTGAMGHDVIKEEIEHLRRRAQEEMGEEGHPEKNTEYRISIDMRYIGQSYELTVPLHQNYVHSFHELHERRYGYRDDSREVEIVTLRLRAIGVRKSSKMKFAQPPDSWKGPVERRPVVYEGEKLSVDVYERCRLGAGQKIFGPALVVEDSATHWLVPGWSAVADPRGHLLLERKV